MSASGPKQGKAFRTSLSLAGPPLMGPRQLSESRGTVPCCPGLYGGRRYPLMVSTLLAFVLLSLPGASAAPVRLKACLRVDDSLAGVCVCVCVCVCVSGRVSALTQRSQALRRTATRARTIRVGMSFLTWRQMRGEVKRSRQATGGVRQRFPSLSSSMILLCNGIPGRPPRSEVRGREVGRERKREGEREGGRKGGREGRQAL